MGRFWELIPLMYVSIGSTRKGEKDDAEMRQLRCVVDVGADRMQAMHTRGGDEVPLMPRRTIRHDGIQEKNQFICLRSPSSHVHLGRFRHQSVCFPRLIPGILSHHFRHLPILYRIDRRAWADVVNDENPVFVRRIRLAAAKN